MALDFLIIVGVISGVIALVRWITNRKKEV
jgi:hypothetical protein